MKHESKYLNYSVNIDAHNARIAREQADLTKSVIRPKALLVDMGAMLGDIAKSSTRGFGR